MEFFENLLVVVKGSAYVIVIKLVGSFVGLFAELVQTAVAHHRAPLKFVGVISKATIRVHGHNFFL